MPWLSPDASPRINSPVKLINLDGVQASSSGPTSPSITYIPPLVDGACGTTLKPQRPVIHQLRGDVSAAVRLLPALLLAAVPNQRQSFSLMDIVEMTLHVGLALLEIYMLTWAMPLWLCLPGAVFAVWLGCCMAIVMGMSWLLNTRWVGEDTSMVRSPSLADGWMMGQDAEDEAWFFVGGMGSSSRSLAQSNLPTLSKLFSRAITAVHTPTYGLPFDFVSLLFQRSLHTVFHSSCSRMLYIQLRTALLDVKTNRTVVLAHNTGAVTVSHVLRQLYADIPVDKMSKLEVYTFGAAATEFVMPLGSPGPHAAMESKKTAGYQQPHAPGLGGERYAPHIEHFAFANDPLARMGILRSVREDLEGRFCGGVFVLNCHHSLSSRPPMSMTDYMACLFPQKTPSSMSGQQNSSILDGIMAIDRGVAVKREFAAMANHSSSTTTTKKTNKRLSWTGLGATVGGNGNMAGVDGLEMARNGCKDCDGHTGREVSRLVRHVNMFMSQSLGMERKSVATAGVGRAR